MDINNLYDLWINNCNEDNDLIDELNSIKDNESEIYERFYRELEFGTAGLRGIIGVGTNRMNIYTIRRATQGLANYINSINVKNPAVAIAYDSRIKSKLFAKEAARVLASNDIKVYITKEIQPTPVLSFVVREYGCDAGIMITASHNPAKYNGYKCYGSDGCQMTDKSAGIVYNEIRKVDIFNDVKVCDFDNALDSGLISFIEDNFYDKYIEKVKEQRVNKDIKVAPNFKVVYTPLNGAGNRLVRRILSEIGIENIYIVKEQEVPDGNFPTCPYPNPEIKQALELAIELAERNSADLVIATDPDSDRVGIAVKDGSYYRLMTGNEVGILLINYILSCRTELNTLPSSPFAVKTIVSSEMVTKIANDYNCELKNVLTGFKYIGEQILNLEKQGQDNRFIFGFEESYGYLAGTYVRDKDAVVASMLICEMCVYYNNLGKSLLDVMNELCNKYGFYQNSTTSFEFEGSVGMKKMDKIMFNLRNNPPTEIAGKKVVKINDYSISQSKDLLNGNIDKIDLPKSNVLFYFLEGGASTIVRPSGTEPKIKVYVTSVEDTLDSSLKLKKNIESNMTKLLGV